MKKQYFLPLAVLLVALVIWLTVRIVQSPAPREAAVDAPPVPKSSAPPVPSMPFAPSELQTRERVSRASLERMQARAEELREGAQQLGVKMKSIEVRLTDTAEESHHAALQEAKQNLELGLQKMRLEEKALADFLRNELGPDAPSGP